MPTRSKLLVLTAVMASLLEIIDTSIVNVAVPTMMGNLGATLDEISWVITGYIIANAIVLPIASWFSEQLGRKRYYTGCIVLFTAASVACGLAPNLPVLVIFRVIQGFAGGALLPTSQSLIYEAFPREQAGMASALYGMSVMIGPTVGPTLGGYLTDNFGWRSIFNVNLPIGIVVAMLSYFLVEDVGAEPGAAKAAREAAKVQGAVKRQRTPVDGLGLGLLVVGVGCAQYVLERGHADDWFASKGILIGTVLAIVSLVGLIIWELKAPHPILQLRHFSNPSFRAGILLMAAMGSMLYGLIFFVPVFSATVLGLTATQVGELFIPGALASAAAMPMIGKLLRKRDPRQLVFCGITLLSIGAFFISRFDALTSVAGMFWPLLIRGVAMGFLFVPINSTVLSQFTGPAIGQAAGMLNLCRQLGGSLAIAVFSTIFQQEQVRSREILAAHLTPFDPAATQALAALTKVAHSAQAAFQILDYRVRKQAFVLAYEKTILVAVCLFLVLALSPLSQLKAKKSAAPAPGAAGAH